MEGGGAGGSFRFSIKLVAERRRLGGRQIEAVGIVLIHTCGHPEVNLNKLDSLEGVGMLSVLIYVSTLSCSGETYL